jgi:putative transposase
MLRVNLGALVVYDGRECTVIEANASAARLRQIVGGHDAWIDVPSAAAAGLLRLTTEPAPAEATPSGVFTNEELADARQREFHLLEVRNGLDAHDSSRPGMSASLLTERRAAKAKELRVSTRTLSNWDRAYTDGGLHALIDRRGAAGTAKRRTVSDEVHLVVVDVLESTTFDSTLTDTMLINKVRALMTVRYPGLPIPSHQTLRRVFDDYDPQRRRTGKATTRRSEANRPQRGPHPLVATYPGQYVEIDSTPANVLCAMDDGKPGRPALTIALDIATRSRIGLSVLATTSGHAHADLLARILLPRRYRHSLPPAMRLADSVVLPAEDMVLLDARQAGAIAMPYIRPETITTDRGNDYLSSTFVSGCAQFGISIAQAPPYSPTFKPHVERTMRTIDDQFFKTLPGYVGNSVANRGREAEITSSGLLTIAEFADLFEQWLVLVWQNRPNDGLRDRSMPGRPLTPNQMYAAMFDASAGIPVPIDEGTYISLMPIERRTIQAQGIMVRNIAYWSDGLLPWVGRKCPTTKDGKWEIHYDPMDDERVWAAEPKTGRWIECISTVHAHTSLPFGSSLRKLRDMPSGDPDIGNKWAQAEYAKRSRKNGARKAGNDVTLLRQRAGEPRPTPVPPAPPAIPLDAPPTPGEFTIAGTRRTTDDQRR